MAPFAIAGCGKSPPHPHHPPLSTLPLRIQVLGNKKDIKQVFYDGSTLPSKDLPNTTDFNETGLRFAKMTFRLLYNRDIDLTIPRDFDPRYQYVTYFGKLGECPLDQQVVDGYGITFDHLVDPDEIDPEVLMINVFASDSDMLSFQTLDLTQYNTTSGPSVVLIPRCCQVRKGSRDRKGVNDQVNDVWAQPVIKYQHLG